MSRKLIDLTGETYGQLKVLSRGPNNGHMVRWNCACACGKETLVRTQKLRSGETKSCGCVNEATKHGYSPKKGRTKVYMTWTRIISRCHDENNPAYEKYGQKGVSVCDRWRGSFENFLEDMGEPPSKDHSIDRINVYGNYEPGNCRWATTTEQARNKRISKLNTSGIRGVHPASGKWVATIGVNGERIRLGRFVEKRDAEIARHEAEKKYWGKST